MLILKNITKEYTVGSTIKKSLKGINIVFRDHEFVSILGPSGSGKTTLLNIIGGLDDYTCGDLSVNRKTTKEFSDRDWDDYRSNMIGFVFQNNGLFLHQTALDNVELSLRLSGMSRSERMEKSIKALNKVGLGDQLDKKPEQMSCGQMKRVAIARALVNDPEILLADDPTSTLDPETARHIMEILKELSEEKLIIMVTGNPELAELYTTRRIELLDGNILIDSNPYHIVVEKPHKQKLPDKNKRKKATIDFYSALFIVTNHLTANKAETFRILLSGFGCITGIALIWAFPGGFLPIEHTSESISFLQRIEAEFLYVWIVLTVIFSSLFFTAIAVSVLQRTGKIGILRSIGASKKDIFRLLAAGSLIIGFITGVFSVCAAFLLLAPAGPVSETVPDQMSSRIFSFTGGMSLILISMALSFIAGLIPTGIAVSKSSAAALRNE